MGHVIKLKPGAYEEYKRLHADVWNEVLAAIHKANIRNYSIFHWGGFLFAYMEYIGDDLEADMAAPRATGGKRWNRCFTRNNISLQDIFIWGG